MAVTRTFSIIKPDATRRNLTGAINAKIEEAGLRIIGQRRIQMTREQAQAFYAVHAERPFYNDLVEFMTSGPVVVQVLEGENAVTSYREIMGATNPADAADGTIRKLFAESIEANSVHGSDSDENAAIEIGHFFTDSDMAEGHEHASVWLSSDVGANQIKARYLALTAGLEPPDIQQFDRIFNLFDGTSETAVAVARDSWRRWSALEQVSCRYFSQDEQGRWSQKK